MVFLLLRIIELGLVFPDNFRSITKTNEAKEKVFYGFRVIGYCFGIQEQFNLFSWPIEDIEHIARYDFWTNIYPAIVNRDNLLKIKLNSFNKELFDKSFTKLVYYLWKKEIHHMAYVAGEDESVLGEKENIAVYIFFKNICSKLPNSLAIFLIRRVPKYKRCIMNFMKVFNKF